MKQNDKSGRGGGGEIEATPKIGPHIKLTFNNYKYRKQLYNIVAIETPGGKRNLNMNINAQQAILHVNAYISNN